MATGYCLRGPGRTLFSKTFSVSKVDCWGKSFEMLFDKYKWMSSFWKMWEASIKAAKKHGYVVVKVKLTETR